MNSRLNIYTIGMDSAWCNKDANLNLLEEYLQGMPSNTDLVVLPELFSTCVITEDEEMIRNLSERNTGDTMQQLKKLAENFNVAIAGSYISKTEPKIYNRAFFIEPNGESYYYDKRHLFGSENKYFTRGENLPPVIRFRGCNIMTIVCYDLRFPCWCFNKDLKYDLLLVVASWPKVREYAWEQLLIARAIENQAFVCGSNRSGSDINGLEFPELSSKIYNFKGEEIGTKYTANSMWASLDLNMLNDARQKFPVWKDADDYDIIYNHTV